MFHYFDGYKSSSRFADLDIIFIAGDVFDCPRESDNPELVLVLNWFRNLAEFCARHKIKLRVLEGTPGHDYKQSSMLTPVAQAIGDRLDYRYVSQLEIEIMEDLDLSVLYVPDEWKNSAAKAKQDVIDAMAEKGLTKIDIGCMHGMFDFQIPELGEEHPLKHDSAWYQEIICGFINIGHDHSFKTCGRILVQGSFERLAQGEEGKKGAIVCTIDPVAGLSYEFIENKRARIYKTITIKTKDLEKGIAQARAVLDTLPFNAHVRISTTPDNPILAAYDVLKADYHPMTFKKHMDKKQLKESKGELNETISLSTHYESITLNKENIVDMTISAMDPEDIPEGSMDLLIQELRKLL